VVEKLAKKIYNFKIFLQQEDFLWTIETREALKGPWIAFAI
jgi:hypothetical protein